MDGPLEDLAFLARSENRVAILRALDTAPRDRRDLEAETGVSRSTLSRVLADLEERGWIRRRGEDYTTTTAGSLVVEWFVPLLETLGGIRTLGDGLEYLPFEEMSVEARRFEDAELVRPTEFDPTADFEYGVERLRESGAVRSVGRTVPPPYVRGIREAVAAGDLAAEIALDGDYLDAIRGSDLARAWRDIAAEAGIYRCESYVPYRLFVLDDVVHLWLCSGDGDRVGLLESDSPAVREWAESTVADYRERAERIRPEVLA